MTGHELLIRFHTLNIVTRCRQSGQSIDEQGSYLHANGVRPIDIQHLVSLLATIGYDITQPHAPLSAWRPA